MLKRFLKGIFPSPTVTPTPSATPLAATIPADWLDPPADKLDEVHQQGLAMLSTLRGASGVRNAPLVVTKPRNTKVRVVDGGLSSAELGDLM